MKPESGMVWLFCILQLPQNHIQLLVFDDKSRDVIPQSIKLLAGRTGQEYNVRKNLKTGSGHAI